MNTAAKKGLIALLSLSVLVLIGRYYSPQFDASMEQAPFGFESTFHRDN